MVNFLSNSIFGSSQSNPIVSTPAVTSTFMANSTKAAQLSSNPSVFSNFFSGFTQNAHNISLGLSGISRLYEMQQARLEATNDLQALQIQEMRANTESVHRIKNAQNRLAHSLAEINVVSYARGVAPGRGSAKDIAKREVRNADDALNYFGQQQRFNQMSVSTRRQAIRNKASGRRIGAVLGAGLDMTEWLYKYGRT